MVAQLRSTLGDRRVGFVVGGILLELPYLENLLLRRGAELRLEVGFENLRYEDLGWYVTGLVFIVIIIFIMMTGGSTSSFWTCSAYTMWVGQRLRDRRTEGLHDVGGSCCALPRSAKGFKLGIGRHLNGDVGDDWRAVKAERFRCLYSHIA